MTDEIREYEPGNLKQKTHPIVTPPKPTVEGSFVVAPNTAPGKWQHVYIGLTRWPTTPVPGIEALADTGSFTVTGGYAKINTIEVPMRTGLTVFAGFDPVTATLPVLLDRFGVNPQGEESGTELAVEKSVQMLEWMGGRGLPLSFSGHTKKAAAPANERPPEVELTSNAPNGNPTRLIPFGFQYNANNPTPPRWMITGLNWGESIRDKTGNRQRQRVTVTFTQSVTNPVVEEYSAVETAKGKANIRDWGPYLVKDRKDQGGETPLEIATFVLHHTSEPLQKEVAQAIRLRVIQMKIKCPHLNSTIPKGTKLLIPHEP